jgi:predicted peptidase
MQDVRKCGEDNDRPLLMDGQAHITSEPNRGFIERASEIDGVEYGYRVYIPAGYCETVPSPVILALHGSGEVGTDGRLPTEVGLGRAIRRYPDRYPAICIFPQVPAGEIWQGLGAQIAIAALDRTIAEFNIDLARVYLTGISMGGNGSWYLAYHFPQRFAAVVVVCGWIGERNGKGGVKYPAIGKNATEVSRRLDRLPLWIFHGAADAVVPVAESRLMATALRSIDANVRYTEFPAIGHNSWDRAYALAELTGWLFAQNSSTQQPS